MRLSNGADRDEECQEKKEQISVHLEVGLSDISKRSSNSLYNVVGADLVEFNPARDTSGITAMLAAKLYKELLDLLLKSDRPASK